MFRQNKQEKFKDKWHDYRIKNIDTVFNSCAYRTFEFPSMEFATRCSSPIVAPNKLLTEVRWCGLEGAARGAGGIQAISTPDIGRRTVNLKELVGGEVLLQK
jgi:hypothetical protein